jgi:hypothetical protein
MKSFIEYREWQDVKKLANRAANLMVELDVDVEEYLSEFVESYTDKLSEQEEKKGWWANLKDKWKSSQLGGAVTAGLAAGKEQHALPKYKFAAAMAGLQALVGSMPKTIVAGMRSRDLKVTLQKLVDQLQGEKQAIDAVGPKAAEMSGISHADKRAARIPTTSSTETPGEPVPHTAVESTQVVENAEVENTENENTEVENENTEVENTKKEYDPSKGSWYVDDDGNVVPNMPPEDDQNGFFGSW